jgi:sarcosine oxidase subunit beta
VAAFEANVALQNDLGVPSRVIGVDEARRLSPPSCPWPRV